MTGPSVSVLLPVHDAADTLATCLRSLTRQTVQDWECVLVDDGSRDGSLAIARRFAREDERIRVIERPHEGLVAALNAGIAHCRAPIVARMDADDWMHRERLAAQRDHLDRHPGLAAVGCGVRLFPREGLRDGRRRYEAWLDAFADPAAIWRERFIECPIAHPTLAIRRDALARLGYRDRGWPEDWDLLLRLLRDGPCVGIVPRRLLGWRDGPERLSRTHPRYALERFTACRAWHLARDFLAGHARYVLWGHGRTGRALRKALAALGRDVTAIVDVHPRRLGERIGGAPVIPPEALPTVRPARVVVSVAGAGPRQEIREAMDRMGFEEGDDYVCAA
ncbi:MAG: glycosyltransferase [Spirochaetaceae bacterium]|nr:glycosyltransferase [Myxococcales bacterium]MCB9724338.1 glycosyltransferase [Spirochaetaceae bacterium]